MPEIDLELQLRFLRQLDDALDDALTRHGHEQDTNVGELRSMRAEVLKAQALVSERMGDAGRKHLAAAG